jgi:hypothetical protein
MGPPPDEAEARPEGNEAANQPTRNIDPVTDGKNPGKGRKQVTAMNTTNTDIYTVDGGPVTAEVPRIGRWTAIEIIAVRLEDDDPKVTGHECRCGDLHEKATDDVGIDVIQLAPDKAVQLAYVIIRLATPLINA